MSESAWGRTRPDDIKKEKFQKNSVIFLTLQSSINISLF